MQNRTKDKQSVDDKPLARKAVVDAMANSLNVGLFSVALFAPLDFVRGNKRQIYELLTKQSYIQLAIKYSSQKLPASYTKSIEKGLKLTSLKHGSEAAIGESNYAEDIHHLEYFTEFNNQKTATISDILPAVTPIAFPVLTAVIFGLLETVLTQSRSVKKMHYQQQALLETKGLNYTFPEWKSGFAGWYSRTKTAFPARAIKNASVLSTFPVTAWLTSKYALAGYTADQANYLAIGTVATTFGVSINLCNQVARKQILSGKSTRAILTGIYAQTGWRGFLMGAGSSIINTGYINWVVPKVENFVTSTVLPFEKSTLNTFIEANNQLIYSQIAAEEAQYQNTRRAFNAIHLFFSKSTNGETHKEAGEIIPNCVNFSI